MERQLHLFEPKPEPIAPPELFDRKRRQRELSKQFSAGAKPRRPRRAA